MNKPAACPVVVIGYGNTLRGDDGVGPFVAQRVQSHGLPEVRVLSPRQLTPELAAELANAELAIYVDARMAGEECGVVVESRPISPRRGDASFSHHCHPASILALARDLFGRAPAGWWVTIAVERFEPSEFLSPPALAAAAEAERTVLEIVSSHLHPAPAPPAAR